MKIIWTNDAGVEHTSDLGEIVSWRLDTEHTRGPPQMVHGVPYAPNIPTGRHTVVIYKKPHPDLTEKRFCVSPRFLTGRA